ncbi:MAG: tetratricopeptide repeat protein [Rhizobiaceae bacterium]|nr:MAG: tetratricopeptide repeat protein [Rhizobiaceae bacterium]CAG1014779.1 hypothetical protein RHIZO_04873 [Rhizobiaceae bacterium]
MRCILALFLSLLFMAPALAERRVALVVGADAYRSLRPLDNAVSDAVAMRETLEGLGFEVTLETDRDLKRMRRALDDFREDGAGADVALFFFAGHGVEIGGDNRLLPIDADVASATRLRETSLALEEVHTILRSAARASLVVLDACRNDPFGLGESASDGRGVVVLAGGKDAVRPGLGRIGRADGALFAFSAAPGETASDGIGPNSPFTTALSKYLPSDGLEIRSVLTLVQQEVYDLTRGAQLPYVESGLPDIFFAARRREDLPERERLLLAMADVTPELRAEIEAVARDADVPLAPLYGALLESGGTDESADERSRRLHAAAQAFVEVRDQLRSLGAADPEVARLRGEAEAQLALGAFDAARARFADAAALDDRSRQALKANFGQRTLSEAATRLLSGAAARTALRYELAIADYEKALALFDEAGDAALVPEHADRRLAALETLGLLYETTGDVAAARDTYDALRHWAERRAETDDDPSIRRDVAKAQTRLADALVAMGDLDRALGAYRKGRAIFMDLTEGPSGARWLRDLAIAHDGIGGIYVSQGDIRSAIESFGESLSIKQRLADASPRDAEALRDLTVTYDEIGKAARVLGDLDDAREAFAASLAIREDLLAAEPDAPGRQRDLAVSRDNMGDVLRDAGDRDGALASYRAALDMVRAMASRDPNDTQLTRDISVSTNKIGNVLRDAGELDAAGKAFFDSLVVVRALAARDPANADWQRDLSVTLEKVADVERQKGKLKRALAGFEESLVIVRRLVASDPGNADWQRDLSITLAEVGNLKLDLKDLAGARDALEECLAIREALGAGDPGNALWQRDLIIAYADIAMVSRTPRQPLEKALAIAEALDAEGRLPPRHRWMIDQLKSRLARLRK